MEEPESRPRDEPKRGDAPPETDLVLHDSADAAEDLGIVALSDSLDADSVLQAYRSGVFPWPLLGERGPIFWCSPDPRFVLFPAELRVPRGVHKVRRRGTFSLRWNERFDEVVEACRATPRLGQSGESWITEAMRDVYGELHRLGFAHSVECHRGDRLVGGLYGLAIGGAFFGESMFFLEPDASKLALVELVEQLAVAEFELLDCQQQTEHLGRFGARALPRGEFLAHLKRAVARTVAPLPNAGARR